MQHNESTGISSVDCRLTNVLQPACIIAPVVFSLLQMKHKKIII